jgi:hypothetical protein
MELPILIKLALVAPNHNLTVAEEQREVRSWLWLLSLAEIFDKKLKHA